MRYKVRIRIIPVPFLKLCFGLLAETFSLCAGAYIGHGYGPLGASIGALLGSILGSLLAALFVGKARVTLKKETIDG